MFGTSKFKSDIIFKENGEILGIFAAYKTTDIP